MTIAKVKKDRADLAASRRAQVLRRLRWAAPAGVSQRDIEDRLDWPPGTGASVLRDCQERGEAHQRGGCWYLGEGGPRPVAVVGTAAGHTPSDTREKQEPGPVVAAPAPEAQDRAPASETRSAQPGRTSTARRGGPGETEAPAPGSLRGQKGAPRVRQVVAAVEQHPGLAPRDVAVIVGCTAEAASAALRAARKAGHVRAEGSTMSRRYFPVVTEPGCGSPGRSLERGGNDAGAGESAPPADPLAGSSPAGDQPFTAPVDAEPADSTPVPAPSTEGGPPHALEAPQVERPPRKREDAGSTPAEGSIADRAFASGTTEGTASAPSSPGPVPDSATLDDLQQLGLTVRAYNILDHGGYLRASAIRAASDAELVRLFMRRHGHRRDVEDLRHLLEHGAPVPRPTPEPFRPARPAVDLAALVGEWLDGLRPSARAELSAHDTTALIDAIRDVLTR